MNTQQLTTTVYSEVELLPLIFLIKILGYLRIAGSIPCIKSTWHHLQES